MTASADPILHPRTARWSGFETPGMRDAKCSLLLQEEATHDATIKALPKQRILVYQDRGFNPASSGHGKDGTNEESFYVDFKGATILQLEPTISYSEPQIVMPITLTIGGRCVFTPENYQDFKVMMRTKEQSEEMAIAPNGNFDWPDVHALLLCPCCGNACPIPFPGDKHEHEYWMVFYPLLQITILKGSQMTLGTRTVCRLTCLECMDNMLEGLTLNVVPGGIGKVSLGSNLAFTLPAGDVLAEAGSASFLEDGPPRPESHPHVDDILDAWTLYNLWEHSGAWEALQNDHRLVLSRSMHSDALDLKNEAGLKHRLGQKCGNPACTKVHGNMQDGEICRLYIKCRECHSEFYCSWACRENCLTEHVDACQEKKRDREERREKRAKKS